MFNPEDFFRTPAGAPLIEQLARQYGAGAEQMRAAAGVMLPAMSEAFKRMAASPNAFAAFSGAAPGWPPGMAGGGTDPLAAFFGSPEAARTVADQVKAASGLSADAVRQLIPPLAATLVGIVSQAFAKGLGASEDKQPDTPPNPFAAMPDAFAAMMAAMARPAAPEPSAEPPREPPAAASKAASEAPPEQEDPLAPFLAAGRALAEQQQKGAQEMMAALFWPKPR